MKDLRVSIVDQDVPERHELWATPLAGGPPVRLTPLTHHNDVIMLYPVFHAGRIALFAATRCHWGYVGGMTPGSLSGRVRDI